MARIDSFAATTPPPPALPPWGKILWWVAGSVAQGIALNHFDFGAEMQPTSSDAGDPDASTWRRFQIIATNDTSSEVADDQTFTMDIVNYTNGIVDSSWNAADYATVTDAMGVFLGAIAPLTWGNVTFAEIKAYVMAFNPVPADITKPRDYPPFAQSGAPDFVRPVGIPGAGGGSTAPQASSTLTEITPSRPHWGRMYLPTLAPIVYGPDGRLTPTTVSTLVTALSTLYTTLHGSQFTPVVPTTQSGGVVVRTLQNVTSVRCDDLPDVQRSRRPRHFVTRITLPAALELLPAPE